MGPDIFKQLEQLQRQATQLGELAGRLRAATPERADGADATGWVRVSIGNDGRPWAIQIRNGWNQRIEAAMLGAAVMEANADAVNSAMRVWSDELDQSSWWAQRARLEEDDPGVGRADASTPPAGTVRDTTELTEEVLSAMQTVRQRKPAMPTACDGSDPNRHVMVQLGQGGLLSCSIDPGWATRMDGDAITAAVSRALHAAIARMAPAKAPAPDLDRLVADALATLQAVTQLRDRPGGNA